LIIDDSPVIREVTQYALVEAGYKVETREGIEDMGQRGVEGFDLILMDVQMPELFGDDVAGILRHQRALNTPIYLFSTLPDEELRERATEAGINGFISKSAGTAHLIDEVNKIFGAS
jgi:CheY-like chemotaxis protein